MGRPDALRRWTRDEVLALPDDGMRHELFDGELVVSPSSARYDRGLKRRAYQRAGVSEYGTVDPEARIVERWRPGDQRPEILLYTLTWHPEQELEPLVLDLGLLFRDA
jgi:Uma2 family endonuclease